MYLETKRMILKEYELGDHDLMYDLDSDPEVVKHVGGKQNDYQLYIKAINRYIAFYKENHGCGYYKVYLKENPTEYVGWYHLRPEKEEPNNFKMLEVGYRFKKKCWNKGLATEGTLALVKKSFEDLAVDMVTAKTSKLNIASQRVMQKSGMILDETSTNVNPIYSVRYLISNEMYNTNF